MADPITLMVMATKAVVAGAGKAGAAATSSKGLAALSTAASVGRTVLGGLGAARRSAFDAQVARDEARLRLLQGNEEAMAVRRQAVVDFSRARAMAASSGVQFSGTVLELAAQEAALAELEARQIMYASTTQSDALNREASELRRQRRAQLISTAIGATGDIAGGVRRTQLRAQEESLRAGSPVGGPTA